MQIEKIYLSEKNDPKIEKLIGNSFFASTGFLNLWSIFGGKAVYWSAIADDDIIAVLPGVEFGAAPIKRFQANPDGCYSCFFIDEKQSDNSQEIKRLIVEAIARAGYTRTHIYDYYKQIPLPVKNYRLNDCRTNLINVSDPNWLPPDKKIQSELRKADREQPEIRAFKAETDFDKFMNLMRKTEERHNRPPRYSKAFYKKLTELSETDNRIIWLWCEHDGEAVTTHINFKENDMILNWQVFYDKNYSYLKVNQQILYYLGINFNSEGVKFLNLGASPEEASGLRKYKSKWGGESYFYPCFSHKSWLGKFLG